MADFTTAAQTPFLNAQRLKTVPNDYQELGLGEEYEFSRAAAIHQPVDWRKTTADSFHAAIARGTLAQVRCNLVFRPYF